jgi:hypothetical protein
MNIFHTIKVQNTYQGKFVNKKFVLDNPELFSNQPSLFEVNQRKFEIARRMQPNKRYFLLVDEFGNITEQLKK